MVLGRASETMNASGRGGTYGHCGLLRRRFKPHKSTAVSAMAAQCAEVKRHPSWRTLRCRTPESNHTSLAHVDCDGSNMAESFGEPTYPHHAWTNLARHRLAEFLKCQQKTARRKNVWRSSEDVLPTR